MPDLKVLLNDLILPEGPRWRDDRLYLSDFIAGEVIWCDLAGNRGRHLTVASQPSGLGWLPDGRMVVSSIRDASILIYDDVSLEIVVDLSDQAACLNDLVVDDKGHAYVGGMPNTAESDVDVSQLEKGVPVQYSEKLFLIDAADKDCVSVHVAAADINFPNGAAITENGATLILAETMSNRVLAFDVGDDGMLHNKRVWANLPGMPDGLCLDAEGCIWTAIPFPENLRGVYRVSADGALIEKISTDWIPLGVMLGGPDRKNLFVTEVQSLDYSLQETHKRGNGRLSMALVDVPGAGLP